MKNSSIGSKYIKVKVIPGSGVEKVEKRNDRFVIKVKEEAREGLANRRVLEILTLIFPEKRIELVKGGKRKNKIFKINEK